MLKKKTVEQVVVEQLKISQTNKWCLVNLPLDPIISNVTAKRQRSYYIKCYEKTSTVTERSVL